MGGSIIDQSASFNGMENPFICSTQSVIYFQTPSNISLIQPLGPFGRYATIHFRYHAIASHIDWNTLSPHMNTSSISNAAWSMRVPCAVSSSIDNIHSTIAIIRNMLRASLTTHNAILHIVVCCFASYRFGKQ